MAVHVCARVCLAPAQSTVNLTPIKGPLSAKRANHSNLSSSRVVKQNKPQINTLTIHRQDIPVANMPVTVRPSPEKVGRNQDKTVTTDADLLSHASKAWTTERRWLTGSTNKKKAPEDRPVLQSSFAAADTPNDAHPIAPYPNGFVTGVLRAFNQDLHLVLRPDDVWLAVLTQFSRYLNGPHAEELRDRLVAPAADGKKIAVTVYIPKPVRDADMGLLARAITQQMEKHIVDDGLRDWAVARFSTTTDADAGVAALVLMGCMQRYFEYIVRGGCGFPSVTLLGERADWEALGERVDRLGRYGEEAARWGAMLAPVVRGMVRSFEAPESDEVREFWMRACYEAGEDGSGGLGVSLSGWITAFCFWDEDGERVRVFEAPEQGPMASVERRPLVLSGVEFPMVHPGVVPNAFVTVPVALRDVVDEVEYVTTVVVGHVGMALSGEGTTAQPRSGFWVLVDEEKPLEH